jgi:hypothetical protein
MQRRYEEVGALDPPHEEARPGILDPPPDQVPTSRFTPHSSVQNPEEARPEEHQQDSDNESVHTVDCVSDQVRVSSSLKGTISRDIFGF